MKRKREKKIGRGKREGMKEKETGGKNKIADTNKRAIARRKMSEREKEKENGRGRRKSQRERKRESRRKSKR